MDFQRQDGRQGAQLILPTFDPKRFFCYSWTRPGPFPGRVYIGAFMKRRDFTALLGAGLLGAAAPATAREALDDGTRSSVRFFQAGRWHRPQSLVLTSPHESRSALLDEPMPHFFEGRSPMLQYTPLARFSRAPFAYRFSKATPLGGLYLSGDRLLITLPSLDLLNPEWRARGFVTLGLNRYSWDIWAAFLPTAAPVTLAGATEIGATRLEDNGALVAAISRG